MLPEVDGKVLTREAFWLLLLLQAPFLLMAVVRYHGILFPIYMIFYAGIFGYWRYNTTGYKLDIGMVGKGWKEFHIYERPWLLLFVFPGILFALGHDVPPKIDYLSVIGWYGACGAVIVLALLEFFWKIRI